MPGIPPKLLAMHMERRSAVPSCITRLNRANGSTPSSVAVSLPVHVPEGPLPNVGNAKRHRVPDVCLAMEIRLLGLGFRLGLRKLRQGARAFCGGGCWHEGQTQDRNEWLGMHPLGCRSRRSVCRVRETYDGAILDLCVRVQDSWAVSGAVPSRRVSLAAGPDRGAWQSPERCGPAPCRKAGVCQSKYMSVFFYAFGRQRRRPWLAQ